jgi:hypothetical protein
MCRERRCRERVSYGGKKRVNRGKKRVERKVKKAVYSDKHFEHSLGTILAHPRQCRKVSPRTLHLRSKKCGQNVK